VLDGIPADIKDFGLHEDIKDILGGNELSRGSWEFEGDVAFVGILFGQDDGLFLEVEVLLKELL
jgi:hypothetical protein